MKQEYGEKVDIIWKSFPLAPEPYKDLYKRINAALPRALIEEPSLSFHSWREDEPYPSHSMRILEAAKCAELQGLEKFDRFHMLLLTSHFEAHSDISDEKALVSLAEQAGLNIDRFLADLGSDGPKEMVLAERDEMQRDYGGWGVPLAIIGGEFPLAGAAPLDMFRRAINVMLGS